MYFEELKSYYIIITNDMEIEQFKRDLGCNQNASWQNCNLNPVLGCIKMVPLVQPLFINKRYYNPWPTARRVSMFERFRSKIIDPNNSNVPRDSGVIKVYLYRQQQ
jgi:hypothetical protein